MPPILASRDALQYISLKVVSASSVTPATTIVHTAFGVNVISTVSEESAPEKTMVSGTLGSVVWIEQARDSRAGTPSLPRTLPNG